ncbi:DNA replication terminus site-binding protein [Algibacillus agarilyticus]|uniref:DNA replication terminus site-binding protein n=1 Tax=Algibacillus agarilyticus TaxID=2234133 RepID=UPI000DD01621|nr:DNA replication terminus site-binding protein [Algibacillus agarilyticus]
MNSHLDLKLLINELDTELDKLTSLITVNKAKINCELYKLGQIDPNLNRSTLINYAGVDGIKEACHAFKHYTLKTGEDTKTVYRYPGLLLIKEQSLFNQIHVQVDKINKQKQIIVSYIEKNNYPITLKTANGELYKKNGLLYQAIPMANHAMLTRKLSIECTQIQTISFSWNHDIITKKFDDRDDYINRVERLYHEPPIQIDKDIWQQQLRKLVNEIHQISDNKDGLFLKWVRRKSPEPQAKYRVIGQTGRLTPHKLKLPLIAISLDNNKKIKKALPQPPSKRGEMTTGRGITYRKLHPNFDFYECTPIKS